MDTVRKMWETCLDYSQYGMPESFTRSDTINSANYLGYRLQRMARSEASEFSRVKELIFRNHRYMEFEKPGIDLAGVARWRCVSVPLL
jgi:hypothetical protein